jgi:DNA-directed RNA polymerase specialized sigma24 family protein
MRRLPPLGVLTPAQQSQLRGGRSRVERRQPWRWAPGEPLSFEHLSPPARRILRATVTASLNELPPRQREVIVRRYCGEREVSVADVAAAMNLKRRSTVNEQQAAALAKLHQWWTELGLTLGRSVSGTADILRIFSNF